MLAVTLSPAREAVMSPVRLAPALVLVLAACATPPGSGGSAVPSTEVSAVDPAQLPPEVVAAARAAVPGLHIVEAELKLREGRRYYDVGGRRPDGQEVELDMLERDGRWKVVEIQRDIAWSAAPEAVRAAAAPAWRGAAPVRVIESRQAEGGEVIYELFTVGQPATPALEVMLKDGRASVLKETWPH